MGAGKNPLKTALRSREPGFLEPEPVKEIYKNSSKESGARPFLEGARAEYRWKKGTNSWNKLTNKNSTNCISSLLFKRIIYNCNRKLCSWQPQVIYKIVFMNLKLYSICILLISKLPFLWRMHTGSSNYISVIKSLLQAHIINLKYLHVSIFKQKINKEMGYFINKRN